jgi:hypothetical protein
MPQNLGIKIGDITTAVEWKSGGSDLDCPPAYQPFISDGRTDILLGLHLSAPKTDSGEKVFDSPPIWSLYRNGDAACIHIFDQHPDLLRLLVFPPHFREADLYFAEPGGQFIDPFFGPTMELLMINYLAQGHGVIIHACGIDDNGKGMLFAGESGSGKSTLTNLWDQAAGVDVLSDDRTLVRLIDGELRMYGTPWHGEAKFGSAQGVKLEKIFFLRHGPKKVIQPLSRAESVLRLLQCSFPPFWDAAGMEYTMEFFEALATRVACHELTFRPDESAIEMIKRHADTATGIK